MKEFYNRKPLNTSNKRTSRKKVEVPAAVKDPMRPVRAASVLQKLEHALKHGEHQELLISPFSNIPQSQLNRALNDLARDRKIELIAIGGSVVVKLAPSTQVKTANKKNRGKK